MTKDTFTETVYFAADHAGFELKAELLAFVRDELGYVVEDCGADTYDEADDYPDFVARAAHFVSEAPDERRAIVIGASGQGEAMVANRFPHVRAAVFYGEPATVQHDASGEEHSIISGARTHNNTNVLSLGARFITVDCAKEAVHMWLETPFSNAPRHIRRIEKIDRVREV